MEDARQSPIGTREFIGAFIIIALFALALFGLNVLKPSLKVSYLLQLVGACSRT